ncbi:SRPBCC family protein [Mucilaginibacter aquatilis]|uniref:Activator of Hsp90 ATPase homologue 1/2-like C-terminal domain-containing protein n=1 Tax=Mucilaginibacter aquatilis TaxID=1517760 RepID=A0A6I4I901_9SPHI|nr:SRPBCC domain-containing protein [Mucilaginibacter aquatilis]MVN89939.1 hypothetical protein [Mucilaginibacter aquatilis]
MENTALRLEASKSFDVSVGELYKAWNTPEALKEWWQPSGSKLKSVELDVKEGGTFKYEFEGKDGETSVVITGEYQEVKENEKLAYSWNWNIPNSEVKEAEHELTVIFVAKGEGSEIKVTQENFENEESINPHQEGWDKALNDLHSYLSK